MPGSPVWGGQHQACRPCLWPLWLGHIWKQVQRDYRCVLNGTGSETASGETRPRCWVRSLVSEMCVDTFHGRAGCSTTSLSQIVGGNEGAGVPRQSQPPTLAFITRQGQDQNDQSTYQYCSRLAPQTHRTRKSPCW